MSKVEGLVRKFFFTKVSVRLSRGARRGRTFGRVKSGCGTPQSPGRWLPQDEEDEWTNSRYCYHRLKIYGSLKTFMTDRRKKLPLDTRKRESERQENAENKQGK